MYSDLDRSNIAAAIQEEERRRVDMYKESRSLLS